jgi:hypothetical protein
MAWIRSQRAVGLPTISARIASTWPFDPSAPERAYYLKMK